MYTHSNASCPHTTTNIMNVSEMKPEYEFRLNPMSSARSKAGGPDVMIPCYRMPINEKHYDIPFVFHNDVASFEQMTNGDKNLKPSGTLGWFCQSLSSIATICNI
jgi:hypothetical protein